MVLLQVLWDGTSCHMVTIYRRFGGACRLHPQRQTVKEKSLKTQTAQEIPSCTVGPCESSDVCNTLRINTDKHPRAMGPSVGLTVGSVSFKLL